MKTSRHAVVDGIRTHVAEHSNQRFTRDAVDPDADLCDRGYIDSLSYIALLAHVEQTYGVRVRDHQLTGSLRTINALAEHIVNEAAS